MLLFGFVLLLKYAVINSTLNFYELYKWVHHNQKWKKFTLNSENDPFKIYKGISQKEDVGLNKCFMCLWNYL